MINNYDNKNINQINQNEIQELQAQKDKIKQARNAKIQKIKTIAEKLGISIDNLSESQIDNLLNKIDSNSFKLLQKLSVNIQKINSEHAATLQQMILDGDFDKALAFINDIHKQQNNMLNNFNDNFIGAQQQLISQTIQDFIQSNNDITENQQQPAQIDTHYDFNIIKYSFNDKSNTITIYADISKIKGYILTGFSFKINSQNILDIICTHDAQKEFFNNQFIIYKFSNTDLIKDNDFVLTMIKIIGSNYTYDISDAKIRILINDTEKEVNINITS